MFNLVAYRRLGQWRWRAVSPNGNRLAHGGEGNANKADCLAALAILWPNHEIQIKEKP